MKITLLKLRLSQVLLGLLIFPLLLSFFVNVSPAFAADICVSADGSSSQPSANGNCPAGYSRYSAVTGALQTGTINTIDLLLNRFIGIINLFIPFLIGLAVFLIIYGIFGYVSQAADEEKRKEARDFIVWGIVGIFCMLSVWGLINILYNTFNLDRSNGIVTAVYPNNTPLPTTPPKTIVELIARLNIIGPNIVGFLIGIAVFVVILGIFNYIREAQNEEKRADARNFIIWGVIFIFLMLSIWGMINILVKTFNFDNTPQGTTQIFRCLAIPTPAGCK
ncbi:MAG: hypothetical protein V4467_00615 [Patescibacteria group bacterium]